MKTESPADQALPSSSPAVDRNRDYRSWSAARVLAAVRARLSQEVVLFLFVLVLAVAFGFNQSVFWSGVNLQNVSRQGAVLAMVAAGEIFPILIGGIDLSVGGQVSMLSIFAVQLSHNMPEIGRAHV